MTPGTFRDPSGSLFDVDGRILRLIRPDAAAGFRSLLDAEAVRRLVDKGWMVRTRRLDPFEVPESLRPIQGDWYEHVRLGFVSLPAEWSAAMLADAALRTLDICDELLGSGYLLKDATPANILFDGPRPVFVDVPSIEPLRPGATLWTARHQFETTFLLPLLACLDVGLPIQQSLADPARGLSHEQLATIYGVRRWARFERIRHVALAAALSRAGASRAARRMPTGAPVAARGGDLEKTRFILAHSLRGLRSTVEKIATRLATRYSNWSGYAATRDHYADQDLRLKRQFVAGVVDAARASWVLDVGANTGEFCEIAAGHSQVVGIDLDEVSVSAIHAQAKKYGKPIQALVVDLSQPTPATGWRNAERKSFLERAGRRFDLALMLAVGHHLRVSAGIPLEQIIETGLQLGRGSLLFEFVPTTDPMFRTIARGREPLYADNTVENCESLLAARATILRKEGLPNGRTLFWARQARQS